MDQLVPVSQTSTNTLRSWYLGDSDNRSQNPAKDAFEEAVKLFSSKLTKDEQKKVWLQDKNDINDVFAAVQQAQSAYRDEAKHPKAWRWLNVLSQRVLYYGGIMDILSQHHPEYVSLVWGTIKFLIMGVLNQEELITNLAKALSQIGHNLPHLELKGILYPTQQMKAAVAHVYALIIKFLQRATNWYKEGKFMHVLHSIGRPYALRFKDLAEDIAVASREVDRLAVSCSQAEQRDINITTQEIMRELIEFRKMVADNHMTQLNTQLDTNKRVCDLQFSNILSFAATGALPSPDASRRYYTAMRSRRRRKGLSGDLSFWKSPQLQMWASSMDSSLVIVKATFQTRHDARDFAADAIDLICDSQIPVIWALNSRSMEDHGEPTTADVFRHLVLQVLQLNQARLTEKELSLSASRFQTATSDADWVALLGSVLDGIRQIYVVVDVEILSSDLYAEFSWHSVFLKLFEELRVRGSRTIVKVALFSYQTPLLTDSSIEGNIIHIRKQAAAKPKRLPVKTRQHGKGRALPIRNLQDDDDE